MRISIRSIDDEAGEATLEPALSLTEERGAADEVALVGLHHPAEARLDGVGRLVDLARINMVNLLEAENSHRLAAAQFEPVILSAFDEGVVHRPCITRIVNNFVPEFSGNAETGDDGVYPGNLRLDTAEIGKGLV